MHILNRKFLGLLNKRSCQSTKNGRILPHPSQMRMNSAGFSMEEAYKTFLNISKENLSSFLKRRLVLLKKLKIAFDFHD